jgi:hypothetical protein
MVSTAYRLEDAANKRFLVLGPEAIRMHEALRRYCAVFHPDIKVPTGDLRDWDAIVSWAASIADALK